MHAFATTTFGARNTIQYQIVYLNSDNSILCLLVKKIILIIRYPIFSRICINKVFNKSRDLCFNATFNFDLIFIATLKFLINVAIILFWIFSFLHGLIWTYTFIHFGEKLSPQRRCQLQQRPLKFTLLAKLFARQHCSVEDK